MRTPRDAYFGALFASLWTAGCASLGGMRTQPIDRGEIRVYATPPERVVAAARRAFEESGLRVQEVSQVDSATWIILGSSGFLGHGSLVRVLVQSRDSGLTGVRVFSQLRLATRSLKEKGDWADDVFEGIGRHLMEAPGDAVTGTSVARPAAYREAAARALAVGTVVRVEAAGRPAVTGRVVGVRDSLLVVAEDRGETAITVSTIDSIWVRKHHQRTGAIIGLVVGGLVGLAVASHVNQGPSCQQKTSISNLGPCSDAMLALFGISAGGAVAGAVVGSNVSSWRVRFP